MADLEQMMRTTFACRSFSDEPLPDHELAAILDVARFAPSGGNRQGWQVIVVRNAERKSTLIDLSVPAIELYVAQRAAGENPWNTVDPSTVDPATVSVSPAATAWYRDLAQAPVFLVVALDLRVVASADRNLNRIGVISGASVYPFAQNILLAARDRGWAGALTTFIAAAEPDVQALLHLPSHIAVAALIPLGRPQKVLTKLTRKPVSEFTHLETFDGPKLDASNPHP